MLDVICVGSATVDKFLNVEESLAHLHLGDKILVKGQEIHSGGGATNAAATFSLFGLKTGIITKLGNDHYADFIQKELKENNIKNLVKSKSKKHTDSSTLIASRKDRDRIILVHKEASLDLISKDINFSSLKKAKWVYLATLVGKSETVAKKIAKYVNENNINLLFNPSLYLAKQGTKKLKIFLDASKIIILNKEEAQELLKDNKSNIKKLLKKLNRLSPEISIITNGNKKLNAFDGNKFYSVVPPDVPVRHTAGSGDAFNSGFLAGMIKGYDIEKALQIGVANASSVVQHLGTKNKLLSEKQALSFIRRHKIKVIKR